LSARLKFSKSSRLATVKCYKEEDHLMVFKFGWYREDFVPVKGWSLFILLGKASGFSAS